MKKNIKKVLNYICWILVGLLSCFSLWTITDKFTNYNLPFFGYRYSVIISNSMSYVSESNDYINEEMKQYQKNDVIITKTYNDFDQIEQYDVVSYLGSQGLICHRVIDKYIREDGEKFLITRGDANNTDDLPVNYKQVKGKVVSSIPGFGHFLLFFQSPYFLLVICGVGFFATLGYYIYKKDDLDVDYTFGLVRRKIKNEKK